MEGLAVFIKRQSTVGGPWLLGDIEIVFRELYLVFVRGMSKESKTDPFPLSGSLAFHMTPPSHVHSHPEDLTRLKQSWHHTYWTFHLHTKEKKLPSLK